MKQILTNMLTLFVDNTQTIKCICEYRGYNLMIKKWSALICALEGKCADCRAIKESLTTIKNDTAFFSIFKGHLSFYFAAMLSINSKHERSRVLADTMTVYKQLKAAKFRASEYLVIAAFIIVFDPNKRNYQNIIEQARTIYDGMKRNHYYTGKDGYIFAVLLALSDIEPATITQRVDELYKRMKSEFRLACGNSVQILSQVLALVEITDEVLGNLTDLRNTLRYRKVKLDKSYSLPILGILSLLCVDGDVIADDILLAQAYLKGKGDYSKKERILYSSAIVFSAYVTEMKDNAITVVSGANADIILAHQAAIMLSIIITATTWEFVGASTAGT